MRTEFDSKLQQLLNSNKDQFSSILQHEVFVKLLQEVKEAIEDKKNSKPLTTKQRRRIARFDVISFGGIEKLIQARKSPEDEVIYYVTLDECFGIIHEEHIRSGHKRRVLLEKRLGLKYKNFTREVINIYLSLCKTCHLKKKHPKKGLVVNPMVFNHMNSRCQVNMP